MYSKTAWVNGSTPVNATNLNKIEQGIVDAGYSLGTNYINVLDYYSGTGTDFTSARAQAITAAGVGGTVFFPKISGGYGYTAPATPLERQRWVGMHSPLYDWDDTEATENLHYALPGFSGGAMILITNPAVGRGATISNMAFAGIGDTTGALNGIDFGPASGGERSWLVKECQFMAFGGAALAGHMWVTDFRDNHISRCGYGIRPASGSSTGSNPGSACVAFDSRWTGGMIYFTYHHAIAFDNTTGSYVTGQVNIANMRLERSGTQVSGNTIDPNSNRDQNANGLYVTRVNGLQLSDMSTDANAGPGFKFQGDVNKGSVSHVQATNCFLKRDGTGDNSASINAGLHVERTTYVKFRNSTITFGDPDDDTNVGVRIAPQRGIYSAENDWFDWDGNVQLSTGNTTANAYALVPNNANASFQSPCRDPRYPTFTAMP